MRFVDTSFWFALLEPRDARHQSARDIMGRGIGATTTSNHVLGETWTLVCRRSGHDAAIRFLDAVERIPKLLVVQTDEALETIAWKWLRRHDEREYSFIDATSFAVMRKRQIREALAFDGDFSAAGFTEVR